MKKITLTHPNVYKRGETTKYWRNILCEKQTVEIKEWGLQDPWFTLQGVCVSSHDETEIGKIFDVNVQTYSYLLEEAIAEGHYEINN